MSQLLSRCLRLVEGDFERSTWEAFRLTVVEAQSTADVAATLHMTAAAVRKAKSRVLSRIRAEFEGLISLKDLMFKDRPNESSGN